jgi:hypothetical protein
MVDNPGKVVGQYAGLPGSFSIRLNKASAITVTRGLVTRVDTTTSPDSFAQAAATALLAGPFAIPVETKGAGETKFSARYNDVIYLTADAAIEPYAHVTTSGTTTGRVVVGTTTSDRQIVGLCLGTAETWNTGSPLAAVQGDLVAVYVPIGGY